MRNSLSRCAHSRACATLAAVLFVCGTTFKTSCSGMLCPLVDVCITANTWELFEPPISWCVICKFLHCCFSSSLCRHGTAGASAQASPTGASAVHKTPVSIAYSVLLLCLVFLLFLFFLKICFLSGERISLTACPSTVLAVLWCFHFAYFGI